ncbi:signal recognition particle subunit SRP72-like [Corticium candelabrum]|uniref:signal recognition particle subunit SRP72-like n=1 Tax=Corticium candelabrum TaxID=121492 RepID=UPI002E25B335|nr:signal recognition particle subunit SRP72-like [Corticium candelabrum]
MAANKEVTVEQLYSQLQVCGKKGDYAKGFKIASQILGKSPDDAAAFHCKIVCLVQQSKFKDVLQLLKSHRKHSEELCLEKAYCHYRLNNLQEAKRLLESMTNRTSVHNELLGQVLYRLENYDSSLGFYKDLIRHSQDEYGDERRANMSAALVGQLSVSPDHWEENVASQLSTDTYELCYNRACMLLYQQHHTAAEEMLQKAEDLCRKSLQDDPDVVEEDIEEELAVIRVQRGYALQLQGKLDAATKLYAHVLKSKPDDISVAAVASNNSISINKDHDIFDSTKKVKALSSDNLQPKLTHLQKRCMLLNRCLLLLYTNQVDQLNRLIWKLDQSTELPVLLRASQAYRDRRIRDAMQILEEYVRQHPDSAMKAQLTLAQIQLAQGLVEEACFVLRSLTSLQHSLGMVSTLVALYQVVNRIDKAKEVIKEAVNFWRERKTEEKSSSYFLELLQRYSLFLLRYSGAKEAAVVLEELRKEKPNDLHVVAQLISAYSQFDAKQAEKLSSSLPALDAEKSLVDVDSLEDSPAGFRQTRRAAVAAASKAQPDKSGLPVPKLKEKKKRKKKKGKLPKNYNPDVDPDPERWLPVRERSYARKKHKKTTGTVGKGTQGAAPESPRTSADSTAKSEASPRAPAASASGTATAAAVSSRTPQQHQAQQPAGKAAQQAKKKQAKKKKGKGW